MLFELPFQLETVLPKKFQCNICFEEFANSVDYQCTCCGHFYCNPCFTEFVRTAKHIEGSLDTSHQCHANCAVPCPVCRQTLLTLVPLAGHVVEITTKPTWFSHLYLDQHFRSLKADLELWRDTFGHWSPIGFNNQWWGRCFGCEVARVWLTAVHHFAPQWYIHHNRERAKQGRFGLTVQEFSDQFHIPVEYLPKPETWTVPDSSSDSSDSDPDGLFDTDSEEEEPAPPLRRSPRIAAARAAEAAQQEVIEVDSDSDSTHSSQSDFWDA
jgi:hypothetical protein